MDLSHYNTLSSVSDRIPQKGTQPTGETICGAFIVVLQVAGEIPDVFIRDSQLSHISGTRSNLQYVI